MEIQELTKTVLFHGTEPEEIRAMLTCLKAEQKKFAKGQMIYRIGDVVSSLGIVLCGSVMVEADDFWGRTTVFDKIEPGQIFAEAYACASGEPLMVNVIAAENTTVLFLNANHVLRTCSRSCEYHGKLIRNLLSLSSRKNLNLSRKIFHTSPKSIRGRLLSYLSDQAVRNGCRSFFIPLNRQQLADYLHVGRSAMSNELSKMQNEGLIRVQRDHFELLDMYPDL